MCAVKFPFHCNDEDGTHIVDINIQFYLIEVDLPFLIGLPYLFYIRECLSFKFIILGFNFWSRYVRIPLTIQDSHILLSNIADTLLDTYIEKEKANGEDRCYDFESLGKDKWKRVGKGSDDVQSKKEREVVDKRENVKRDGTYDDDDGRANDEHEDDIAGRRKTETDRQNEDYRRNIDNGHDDDRTENYHEDGVERLLAQGMDHHDDIDGRNPFSMPRQKGHDKDRVDNDHGDGGERRRGQIIDHDDDDGSEWWAVTRKNGDAKWKDEFSCHEDRGHNS